MNDLPAGWRWVTPDEITGGRRSHLVIGPFGSNLRVSDYRDSGIPLIFVRNIRSRDFSAAATRFIGENKAQELKAHEVRPGDVLITKMGDPPGDSCVYTGNVAAIITADCIRIRPAVDFLPRFIQLAFESFIGRSQMFQITRGVAQKKVSLSRFRSSIKIPVPSLREQALIVEILEEHLSRLDAADHLLQRNANRLAMLRLALLADARRRLIADGTDVRTIGSICDTALGKMLDVKNATGEPTPYLRNINVRWGHVDLAELFTVPLTPAERQHLALCQGDLLVCEGGEPGRCAVWESDSPLIAYQKALHRIRVRDDRLDPYFLAAMLEETVRTGRAARLFTGTTIRHLPQEKLRAIEIPVPTLEIQRLLLGRLNDQNAAVRRFGRQIEQEKCRVANLRRSLLRAAFTGYLSAKSMDIEVAGEMACV